MVRDERNKWVGLGRIVLRSLSDLAYSYAENTGKLLHAFPVRAHRTFMSWESIILMNVEGRQVNGSFVHSPLFFIFIQSSALAESPLSFSISHLPKEDLYCPTIIGVPGEEFNNI
jgi:hypothetical protein